MARTDQELQTFKDSYRKYLGREVDPGAVTAFQGSNISLQDRVRELLGSSEFTSRQQQIASNQYAPQTAQLGMQEMQANEQYDELLRSLEERRKTLPEQTLSEFSRRGLLRSGIASEALGKSLGDLERNITSATRERAYRLADLASRRAQLVLSQQQTANQLIEQPRQQFEENVVANEEAQRKAMIEAQKSQAANTSTVTAGGRVLLIDKSTGQTIADLGSAYKGSGGGSGSGGNIPQGNINNAIEDALEVLGQEDIANVDNADALLAPWERERARTRITAVANQYGVDPNELYNMAFQQGGFGEWNPEQSSTINTLLRY